MSKNVISKKDAKRDNTATAVLKSLKVSPRKANLLVKSIRGMHALKAIDYLTNSTRYVANDVKRLLKSAIANAENNYGFDVDKLYISEAFIGKNSVLKRWQPRARGRAGKILKFFSNITIIVCERKVEK